jgi:cellulose biosynthesis protein BcsQ
MTKIITLFNHKGGVSKTTTAFNLSWMLGKLGKRVIMADFDPQCNLTGMVLGYSRVDDLEGTYEEWPPNNVKDALSPAFESKPRSLTGAKCIPVKGNTNVFLLAGHIGLAEYETTLSFAQELSGSLVTLKNLPGSFRYMLLETAKDYEADYVIVDMSPSLSPVNQNLLMTSDHFVVPLHPDYFSAMALSSLARVLPRWKAWADTARNVELLKTADYPFSEHTSTFAGAIVQKYRPRNGSASKAFQHWIDQLIFGLEHTLVPALEKVKLLDCQDFEARLGMKPWQPILEVADFNSLIALSQEHQTPVYELTKEIVGTGAVWDQAKENMDAFYEQFKICAERIIKLSE